MTQITTRARFAARLKAARRAARLTQESLAAVCGVTLGTVVRWERGDREPDTLIMVARLASALGTTVGALVD